MIDDGYVFEMDRLEDIDKIFKWIIQYEKKWKQRYFVEFDSYVYQLKDIGGVSTVYCNTENDIDDDNTKFFDWSANAVVVPRVIVVSNTHPRKRIAYNFVMHLHNFEKSKFFSEVMRVFSKVHKEVALRNKYVCDLTEALGKIGL